MSQPGARDVSMRQRAGLAAEPPAAPGLLRWFLDRREASVLLMLVVICAGLAVASEYFLTIRNLMNVGRQFSVVGIVALGQGLVIISGGIDLSVGSTIGLAAVSAALAAEATGSPGLGIAAALAAGLLVGLVNGTLITRLRINPFITTLGMLSVARGAALLLTNGNPVPFDNWAAFLGNGRIFGQLPVSFLLMLALTGLAIFFAGSTRWGRNVYAVGDNARAAWLAGVNIRNTRMMVYVFCGGLAGLGGLLLAGNLNTANPNLGLGYELDVIAAVILGGAALSGGRGSMIGVIIGAALMGVLRNGFVLLGVSAYWQVVTIGLVVILAVAADTLRGQRDDEF